MLSTGGTNQNTQNGSHAFRSCAGCGGRINDRFLLHAVDRYWHTDCLKCSCCQAPLADFNSCFAKAGMILCKNDYLRYATNPVNRPQVYTIDGVDRSQVYY